MAFNGMEVGFRFISGAFLPVQFQNLSSSNVVHLVAGEAAFTKYSSDCGKVFISSLEPKECKNVSGFTLIAFSFVPTLLFLSQPVKICAFNRKEQKFAPSFSYMI